VVSLFETMRRRAREAALQALFQMDVGQSLLDDALAAVRGAEAWSAEDWALVETLTRGAAAHQREIDEAIAGAAQHWTIERMAAVDRNILRLAIFELTYTATPVRVIINEAVELAKRYSTEDSGRFVNGLLGTVARRKRSLVGQAADA
jgi:N utilization substance protein B